MNWVHLAQNRVLWEGGGGGFCEKNNEITGSVNGSEFLDKLSDFKIPKDSAQWS